MKRICFCPGNALTLSLFILMYNQHLIFEHKSFILTDVSTNGIKRNGNHALWTLQRTQN